MILGTWQKDRYPLSWVSQRLANRAPPEAHARKAPGSALKQLVNPIALELEETSQDLVEERENIFMSIANIDLLSSLHRVNLYPSISYGKTENPDGSISYDIPRVYGTINGSESEITQAQFNNIKSIAYKAIPSRIEYGEVSYTYNPVLVPTDAVDAPYATYETPIIEGHLYITISGNTTWEHRFKNNIYYPKVHITGTTRKGTEVTENIPIRYNGTFKTVNQWKEVTEVFISYADDSTQISIDCVPFYQDGVIDKRNLNVDINGEEKWRFTKTGTHSWGSSLKFESFTTSDFELIRTGIDVKDVEYEIELLDESTSNITATAITLKPYSDLAFVLDGTKFYAYNINLPYPDVTSLTDESVDVKMDILTDRWIFARDEIVTIQTRILDTTFVPRKTRWTVQTPSATYYMGLDGSLWPTSTDAWLENDAWDSDYWYEQTIPLTLTEKGTYTITLECMYVAQNTFDITTLTAKTIVYVPSMEPEITFTLPVEIDDPSNICFDSDGKLWILNGNDVMLLDVFYDYFLADYSRDVLWLREQYSSVRIEV